MVNGLLSELEDHNCWTLAEAAGHASPCRMQHLLSRARVDERQLLDAAADWAAAPDRRPGRGRRGAHRRPAWAGMSVLAAYAAAALLIGGCILAWRDA